jgi:hypothetical protein
MHDENEYQSQPVRTREIISSLHVGTIERMAQILYDFDAEMKEMGRKFVMRFSCSGR